MVLKFPDKINSEGGPFYGVSEEEIKKKSEDEMRTAAKILMYLVKEGLIKKADLKDALRLDKVKMGIEDVIAGRDS